MIRVLTLFFAFLLLLNSPPVFAEEGVVTRARAPVVPVYRHADSGSEQVTQLLMGDPVEVLEVRGSWARIVVPDQYRTARGYPGWVRADRLHKFTEAGEPKIVTVAYPRVYLRAEPAVDAEAVSEAYLGTRLRPLESSGQWLAVRLPDETRTLWVRSSQVVEETPLSADQGERLVEKASLFKGTPYLWGGMSMHGIDCSGLTYNVYRMHGYTIPRDADQQFLVGEPVTRTDLKAGDLVFFGSSSNDITHVGIYAGEGDFVHASSGRGVVRSKLFSGWYLEHYQGARRVLGGESKVYP